MKKSILVGIFSFLCIALFSQVAPTSQRTNLFEIQAKGLGNSTWLMNKNISDQGALQDYAMAWGFNYGLGFSAYFGKVGFGADYLLGNHMGGYTCTLEIKDSSGVVLSTKTFKSSIDLKVTQIPFLFKVRDDKDGYFELGPQYNIISSATYRQNASGSKVDTVVTSSFSDSYFSAVLGFGFKIKFGNTPLALLAGFRFQYSLSDLKGVDALGINFNNALVYPKPNTTSAATAGVVLGLVFAIGGKQE